MSATFGSIIAVLALAGGTSAHGFVRGITAGGRYYQGADPSFQYQPESQRPAVAGWSAQNLDNGFPDPVYNAPDMICHKSATSGQAYVEVAAGSPLTLHWNTWPDTHKGPVIDYLANARGAFSSINKASLQFVKIAEAGLSGGTWAADRLIASNNSWTTTIPSSIAAGDYVLRHEIIALHSASSPGGAQNYPQCINLRITGGGSNSLPSGTLGTALYTGNEPGIVFNLYNNPTSYPIPGPALMAGGSSGGGSAGGGATTMTARATATANGATTTKATTTVVTATRATTLVTSTRTSSPATSSTSGGGNGSAAALYGQCGGSGWSGPTSCQSGTCKVQNPYYSQCVPN
jgi:lytic cellulose monooxygenase (C1-hydroxylating)